MKCSVCSSMMVANGTASQVYRQGNLAVTISGIPAVMVCPNCNNAVIDWEVAQQIENLVQPILKWADTHFLPSPAVAIAFPKQELATALD